MNRIFIGVLGLLILFIGCTKEKVGYDPTPYILKTPSHFPQMNIPSDNPMTEEGVLLGRMLFYDKQLSLDHSISCGSCHAPDAAFSDPNQFSEGVNGALGTRNSMALVNLGWQNFFFWDGRSATLEEQILQPVQNPIEMHLEWKVAVSRIQGNLEYRNQFYRAFGETLVTKELVAKAIAQFLRTMISGESKYDVMYKFANNIPLTSQELLVKNSVTSEEWAGFDLFKSLNGADCFHCHNGVLLQVQKFSNNGLDAVFSDLGRGGVTNNPMDNGKFKIPTLRNIALSAPYMHDGRFTSLDDVIEHYSTGIQQSSTIDPSMESASQGGVQLDPAQRNQLKAFLLTLTDPNFVTNPDFKPLNP
ncbi:MAG: Cytochrome-c peroxidase [Fluviicola sp.]|jgi:cytochrome c peroxidase|uniref:cytochrome-c peroxidase n=1 Tax=Fluviicola sp. TaxID=1917219 RepID=UPI002630D728|nr:cytochrome c peroxidase [Fluviicola sp.]MDF3029145.1 Cytochrome-c peroxidase [Fluviicola sp.]